MTYKEAVKADWAGDPEISINLITGLNTARILEMSYYSDEHGNQVYVNSYRYETIID